MSARVCWFDLVTLLPTQGRDGTAIYRILSAVSRFPQELYYSIFTFLPSIQSKKLFKTKLIAYRIESY